MNTSYEGLTNRQLSLVLAVEAKKNSPNINTIEAAQRYLDFLEGRR